MLSLMLWTSFITLRAEIMMINILAIRCGLALAPYLCESFRAFLANADNVSSVVRQGGSGLIIRTDGELMLRYQNRETALATGEAARYLATLEFRADYYDVLRTSDEIVFATITDNLLLSHPQSELWLDAKTIVRLLVESGERAGFGSVEDLPSLPEWLSVSAGGGRLLLSDQRNGRWVLLGSDHLAELERRQASLKETRIQAQRFSPPTIMIKGVTVHLQSAFKVARALELFAETGEVLAFEDVTPGFVLRAAKSVEGLELLDSTNRVALTSKEARKWSAIFKSELTRLNANQTVDGRITTVFADGEGGRWALQWGDEVFVNEEAQLLAESLSLPGRVAQTDSLVLKREGEFLLLLEKETGACVSLVESESTKLFQS